MIKTYIVHTKQFEDDNMFEKTLKNISRYRREKTINLKMRADKNRSLAASVALNDALGAYGLKERDMEYTLGEKGKPYLSGYPRLRFSISHSGDYAICSIGEAEIGNDIERVQAGKEKVARRFFTKEEFDWIQGAQDLEEKEERLFQIWTMKESFLKVTGLGMSLSLGDFSVIIKEDDNVSIHHSINEKTYFMKEYAMPDVFKETERYKISVCSESPDFGDSLFL